MAQNIHLEHVEDSILTGDLSVLDWFSDPDSIISTKIDGSPSLVWGTNPANGKWFVATKSAFNKVKIKIAHSHREIDKFYEGRVADILHLCFKYLPRTKTIVQGDWIGVGGSDTYRPNTLTYVFPEFISQDIIVAPHTVYSGGNDLREVDAYPLVLDLPSTQNCLFIQPEVELNPHREDLADVAAFARQMSTLCDFVSAHKATQIKKAINACIREGKPIDEDEIAEKCECDINLLRLWKLVASMKNDLFSFIEETDDIACMIGNEFVCHEGYVITNQFGTFKVVDREVFSAANFNLEKTWC